MMQKIITLFQRNYAGDRRVIDEVVPGAEWVVSGEGTATQKHDGTCCLVRDGQLFKRYEVKKGKTPPPHFEAANDADVVTGKQQGWVPVGEGPEDRWHREAFSDQPDGTYELCGPKIQGNPEQFESHVLVRHGSEVVDGVPVSFQELREWFRSRTGTADAVEGIVWHHPDGRMVKIKARDFGVQR